jgi:hypothetical protein
MPLYDTVVVTLKIFESSSDPGTISVGLIVIFCCSLLFVLMTTLIPQFLDFISPKIGTTIYYNDFCPNSKEGCNRGHGLSALDGS